MLRSTITTDDGRKPTEADRARQKRHDRKLRTKAQEASDEAERVADDMRGGMWAWLRLIGIR